MGELIDFAAAKRGREEAVVGARIDLETEIADLWLAPSGKAWLPAAHFDILMGAMLEELPGRLAGWPHGAPFEAVAAAVVDIAEATAVPGAAFALSAKSQTVEAWVEQMRRIGDAVQRLRSKPG